VLIVPQFVTLPIAVALVWFGLGRGLQPLAALQARIRARRPTTSHRSIRAPRRRNWSPLVEAFNDLWHDCSRRWLRTSDSLPTPAHQMKTRLRPAHAKPSWRYANRSAEIEAQLQQIAAAPSAHGISSSAAGVGAGRASGHRSDRVRSNRLAALARENGARFGTAGARPPHRSRL